MTGQNRTEDLDAVLFAFHRECRRPTSDQIAAWMERYPQYADDIREHAEVLQEWMARENEPKAEPTESMLSRGRSVALNALYDAQVAARSVQAAPAVRTFDQIMDAAHTDVPALARSLDIGRDVLSALVNGRMRLPAGERLVRDFTAAVSATADMFRAAHEAALSRPRLGFAKAENLPVDITRTYEQIVRDSTGTRDDRKPYWLGEV